MRKPVVCIPASHTGRAFHTAKYRIDRLVFVEPHEAAPDAIAREKQLKNWSRGKKIALIDLANPDWRDLSSEIHDYGQRGEKRSLGFARDDGS